jgi:hypothetical protein
MNARRESEPRDPSKRFLSRFFVSRIFGLPILSNDPAPFSSLLHIPTLIAHRERPFRYRI